MFGEGIDRVVRFPGRAVDVAGALATLVTELRELMDDVRPEARGVREDIHVLRALVERIDRRVDVAIADLERAERHIEVMERSMNHLCTQIDDLADRVPDPRAGPIEKLKTVVAGERDDA